MRYYILASGSAGNCTAFVNDNDEILLIDCGLNQKEFKYRMAKAKLNPDNVKAIFITHMHGDHYNTSAKLFSSDMFYCNQRTSLNANYDHKLSDFDHLNLVGFDLVLIPMSHDSPGTTGLIISYNDEKLAYITDTGYVHVTIQRLINNCDYYLIESNHDPRMLMLSNRDYRTKTRILSVEGHLSNMDCASTLANVIGPNTKEICFLHRSREANTEELLLQTFYTAMKEKDIDISNIRIAIAKQDRLLESEDYYEPKKQIS